MKKAKLVMAVLTTAFCLLALFLLVSPAKAKTPVPQGQYVGSETCATCHEDVSNAFKKTIHGKVAKFELGGQTGGCEACHGPGSAHVEDQDPKKIVSLKRLSPSEAGEICLKCHRNGLQMNWAGSAHDANGVSCTSCHDPHAQAEKQLTKKDPDLCYGCHANKQAQMNYPSHHPIREKKMNCSSCHNVHGGVTANLKEETVNELCLGCHAEKQGPFAFEHLPVIENCTICHDAHGSIANSLQRQTQPFLCMQCHRGHEDAHHTAISTKTWQVSFYTKCTQCHSRIHGSDFPSFSGSPTMIR